LKDLKQWFPVASCKTSEVDSFEEVGAVGTAVVVTPIRCRLKGFLGSAKGWHQWIGLRKFKGKEETPSFMAKSMVFRQIFR